MVCIYCRNDTQVTNSRERARDGKVWRRRQCKVCVAQFSTNELPDLSTSTTVRAHSGMLAPFSRDNLYLSIYHALDHRKDAVLSATELTQTIIGQLLRKKQFSSALIDSSTIARTAITILKRFDPLSAHSYRAHHQRVLQK